MKIHEPGKCPWGVSDCSGWGIFAPDPYQSEINLDHTDVWECEGQRYESAQDI